MVNARRDFLSIPVEHFTLCKSAGGHATYMSFLQRLAHHLDVLCHFFLRLTARPFLGLDGEADPPPF